MNDWLKLGAQLAEVGLPSLGSLVGGAIGGAVTGGIGAPVGAGIGGAVGRTVAASIAAALNVEPTPQAISTAVAADPDAAKVKLAQIEAEASRTAAELADIANARATTVQLAQTGSSIAWGAPVISVIVVLGFFGLLILLFFVKQEVPPSVFQLMSVMLGILATAFSAVVQYWVGSSEGSRRNAETVRQVAQSAVTPPPIAVAQQAIATASKR